MPSCPDLDVLARYYEAGVATLPEGASVAAEDLARHIQGCAACRSVIAGLQRTATPSTPPPQGDDAPPPFSPPPRIGRYVIGDVIGAGGMGVVYAAHDPELDRKIALKIVGARDTGDGTAGRVQREARAIAKLSHPNVIAVHDVGTIDGRIFLAMEFAEGGTLREWMARGPRPWREVVAMFVQAGHGLAAAHAAGLVHRDFKPDNVLLDARGRAKVADFGLARAADDVRSDAAPATAPHAPALAATMTKTGAIMGTPAYMAPEQLRAERADARADVFAFSVALYEALYGERPFAGTTLPELVANLEKDRVRDARPGSDVPSWLRALVLQGLRAAPDQRHESMQALVDALEAGGPPVPDDAPVRDEGEPAR